MERYWKQGTETSCYNEESTENKSYKNVTVQRKKPTIN